MAPAKLAEQARARELRALGCSLRRIANELGVGSASVSVWVREVPLPSRAPAEEPPPDEFLAEAETSTRRCSRCELDKPITEFNRHGNGHQWWCRDCFRQYFRARGEVHLTQVKNAKAARLTSARDFLLRYLRDNPCVECGEADPVVLEFDHLHQKRREISKLVGSATSIKALQAEMSVCEVVCVNCHRARTARRGGWRRARSDWRTASKSRSPHEDRNVVLALEALERSGCVDCGLRDLCALDFDHINGKEHNVMTLAASGCSQQRLEAEIARCVVRCANCHRRRTAREGGYWRAAP